MKKQNQVKEDHFLTNEFSEKLVELANAIILVLDKNGSIKIFNKFAEELTGFSRSEVIGKNWFNIFIPDRDKGTIPKVFSDVLNEMPEKSSYENAVLCKDKTERFIAWNNTVLRNKDTEISGTLSIGTDITEARNDQINLQLKDQIFEEALTANSIADDTGIITQVNNKFLNVWGYNSFSEVIGKPINFFIYNKNDADEILGRLNKSGVWEGEYEGLKADGSIFYAYGLASVIKNSNGDAIGYQSSVIDITERKAAEREIAVSENRFRSTYENLTIGVYQSTPDGKVLFANPALFQLLGYNSLKDLQDFNLNQVGFNPKYPRELFKNIIEADDKILGLETEWVGKDGKTVFVRENAHVVRDNSGNILYYEGTAEDVTDRKLIDEALAQSQVNLNNIFNLTSDALLIQDIDGKILDMNLSAEKLFGYKKSELINHPEIRLGDRDKTDAKTAQKNLKLALKGIPQRIDWWGKKKDGTSFPEEVILNETIYNSQKVVLLTIRDITDRKKAEEALRESEETLRSSQQIANLGSYSFNAKSNDWSSSPILDKIFGISASYEKTFDSWLEIIDPDHRAIMQNYVMNEVLTKKNKFDREYKIKRISDGEVRWVHGYGNLEVDKKGNPSKLIGTIQDINNRKLIELALVENERQMHVMMGNMPGMVYRRQNDKNWTMKFISEGCSRITGYSPKYLINNKISLKKIIHPDDVNNVHKRIQNAIKVKKPFENEYRVVTKSGKEKIVWEQGVIVHTIDSNEIFIEGYIWDVTARIKSEQALKESHDRFERIFEGVDEGIVYASHKGIILAVNSGFENITGLAKKDWVGKNGLELMKKFYSLKQLLKIMSQIGPALKGEPLKNVMIEFNDQILEVNVPKVKGGPGITVLIRDITESIEARSKLEKARIDLQTSYEQLHELSTHMENVREEERTSIAREIHDELGQAMTAIKMDLNWMEKRLPDVSPAIVEKSASMRKIIDDTIQSVKRISSELRPGLLDDLGLSNAIEWQAEEFQSRTDISCDVKSDPEEIITDKSRSTVLFRILQEALTNVARHSKATKVKIRLKDDHGLLRLTIVDNGIGITDKSINDPTSYGLKGIMERVYPWRGTVSLTGTKGKGTILIAIIPQNG